MSEAPTARFVGKVLGVAPYRYLGPSDSGRFLLSRSAQALGALLLAGFTVLNSVMGFLTIPHQAVGTSLGLRARTHRLGVAVGTCSNVMLVVSLLGWQHRAVLRVLNCRPLRRPWLSRPKLPYLLGGPTLLGVGVTVIGMLAMPDPANTSHSGLIPPLAFGIAFTVCAQGANQALLGYLLSGVTRIVRDINGELRAVTELRAGVTAGRIRALRRSYKEAADLARRIGGCFGPQLVAMLLDELWFVTQRVYETCIGGLPLSGFILSSTAVLGVILSKGALFYGGLLLSRQGSEVLSNVHALINSRTFDDDTEKESAGMIVTYVVILLQFHDALGQHG